MAISAQMIIRKTGPVFTSAAKQVVNDQVDTGAKGAQEYLARAIKAKEPKVTGELARHTVTRGTALQRSVRIDLARAVPLDSGWLPASTRAQLVRARNTYKLKGKRKLIRALKAAKIMGKRFFYGTFDQVQPLLNSQYLAPVGVGIVTSLGGK